MSQNTKLFGAAFALALCMPHAAEARKIRIPFVPVPNGNTVVLVQDLPDIEALHRADGKYIDLGYRFGGASGGEWVGYIGNDTGYVPLQDGKLELLMAAAGMNELPPVPSRPMTSYLGGTLYTILAAIGVLALVGKGISKLFSKANSAVSTAANAVTRRNKEDSEANSEMDMQRIDQLIAAAAKQKAQVSQAFNPSGARPTFGRRA
jgi:hypothetical protein